MPEGISNIIVALIAGIFTIIGYFLGNLKIRLEHNRSLGLEAWKERCEQYKELIKIMKVLPKYPSRLGEIKYSELLDCSHDLKDWYFDGGGLFLTSESRNAYFSIQEEITEKILKKDFGSKNEKLKEKVSSDDYESVRKEMSILRTELTNDLLSRERNIFMKKNEKDNPKG